MDRLVLSPLLVSCSRMAPVSVLEWSVVLCKTHQALAQIPQAELAWTVSVYADIEEERSRLRDGEIWRVCRMRLRFQSERDTCPMAHTPAFRAVSISTAQVNVRFA